MMTRADYDNDGEPYSNAGSLQQNYPVVGDYIKQALGIAGKQGLAATKTDLVTHSMGGLITREYCRQESLAGRNCNTQIHKLITIDTPHRGSELALLLRDVRDRENSVLHPFEHKLLEKLRTQGCIPKDSICRPLGQAIDDIIPGSDALKNLPALAIPTHVMIGLSTDGVYGHDSVIGSLWKDGLSVLFNYVPDQSFPLNTGCGYLGYSSCTAFFGTERNDRIVTQTSQGGGSNGNGQFDNVDGVDHLTVHQNTNVVSTVQQLLESRPDDTSKFIPILPRAP